MNNRLKLFILLTVSVVLRLVLLGSKSLWIDECLAWGATEMGWLEMFRSVAVGTPHPPLAFITMKLSTALAGHGEFGLRFLISLSVASAVIPVYRLASRRTTSRGGFFAALLWALSPFAVSLGQEAWVYGLNASLSLWFADTADMAWRGSGRAFTGVFLFGAAGILTQHIFVLSIAAGCILYLSVPSSERISVKKFISVPLFLALAYLPVFVYFLPQLSARSARFVQTGNPMGFQRLFSTQPISQLFRLLAGGLVPEMSRNLLERPRMLTAYAVNGASMLTAGLLPFFMVRKWQFPGLKWLWAAFLLPFALYLSDGPTVRQLAVLWVPLSITSAALFSRVRFSGASVCIICAAALVPYYRINEFPYHRSNWREAVETVEDSAEPGDLVVVIGGKSTAFAWEFYSDSSLEYLTPDGDDPFAPEAERNWTDPAELLRRLVLSRSHERIWIVADLWGSPSITSFTADFTLSFSSYKGEQMEIGLIEVYRQL